MKAILVIDMPNSCGDCPFRKKVSPDDIKCLANGEVFEETFNLLMYVRKNKCPLKPMPLKRETHVYWKSVGIGNIPTHEISDYDKGWNDCVEFLEGELND